MAACDSGPRIVNVINFIRAVEPREEVDLLEPVANQIRLVRRHGLPATFLLQYDALLEDRFVAPLRQLDPATYDVGAWLEVVQPLVERAGLRWRGRFPWDWHAHVGFTIGYTPAERERLVDVLMRDFRDTFGRYPASVGSWLMDAHTLAYLADRYGITASCMCKDQIGTDGYTVWGGYWNQAFYPSRHNALMPAQTVERQIPVPVFRMLGSDPIDQYDLGLGGGAQGVASLEPVYRHGGGSPAWVRWFFDVQANAPCLAFAYAQVGQENSFGWPRMAAGLTDQLALLAELRRAGTTRVETLRDSGRWFRQQFALTPPTAVVALKDWRGQDRCSVWYDSRCYRTNLSWEQGKFRVRDLHLFNEAYPGRYLREPVTTPSCVLDTLPLVDGFGWSTQDERAGIRLVGRPKGQTGPARAPLRSDSPPTVQERGPTELVVTWPLAEGGALEIACREDELEFRVAGEGSPGQWALELTWSPVRHTQIQEVARTRIRYEHNGFPYALRCRCGRFAQGENRESVLMHPHEERLVLAFH